MTRLIAPLSAAERAGFLAAARSLVGKKFGHQRRGPDAYDCLGVVHHALMSVGREPSDERKYARDPSKDAPRLRDALCAHFGEPVQRMAPGCVVSMHWHGVPNHVAVVADYYLGGLSVIHALAIEQAVIETRLSDQWPRRIVEVWRP